MVLMRNQNGQKYFGQLFYNVMNMGYMMNCAAKSITSPDEIKLP